jgi:hypothetical protein
MATSVNNLFVIFENIFTQPHYKHNDPFSVLNNYRVNLSHTEHVHLLAKDRPLNLQLTHTNDGLRRVRTQCGQVDVRCGVHVRDVLDADSMTLEVSAHVRTNRLLNSLRRCFCLTRKVLDTQSSVCRRTTNWSYLMLIAVMSSHWCRLNGWPRPEPVRV